MTEKPNRLDPYFEYGLTSDDSENEFLKLWDKYFPFWPILVFLLILSFGGAWLYLKYQPSLYEAKAAVLIKDEKKGVDGSKMTEGLNQDPVTKTVENEIEVIRSRAVISQVVDNLHLYAPVYEPGKWIPHSAYITSPIIVEVEKPAALSTEKENKINFTFNNKDSTIHISGKSWPLRQWVDTKNSRIRFLPNDKSSTVAPNQPFYVELINPRLVTKFVVDNLSIDPVSKLATVIGLHLRDEIPEKAEDILNAIVDEYGRVSLKNKNSLADSTIAFVQERLDKVTLELDSIELRLQNYRSDQNAIDISSQGRFVLNNLSANDQKVSEVDMQLAVLDQIEAYVSSKNQKAEIIPSTLLVSDQLLNQRLEKLYQAELEYDKLKNTVAENNPLLVSVTNQIEHLKPGILESVKNQKMNLVAGKNNLNQTSSKYYSELQAIPKKERDLIEISREQAVKTNLYNFLLQKREDARLSHSSVLPDNFIVDKAEAGLEPIAPKKILFYAIAAFLALAIFVGLITLSETFQSTILYRQEIEKLTTTPIVAEIPYEKSKDPIVIADGKTNFVAEQFRKLRSSLGYLGITGKRKKILITSVIPGEGKSFIAANLATSIALADKKVLLLEFDLINPGLLIKFGMEADKGLSEFLGGLAEKEEIIKQTPVSENLFIIGAGKELPTNPSELILNSHTAELLEYAEAIFDYIVIDSPPVGLRSDAFNLSKLCDATLYVMRHKVTPKKSVQHIDKVNKVNELKNMAIVFNGVKPKGFTKSNYGYGYEYKYKQKKIKAKKTRLNDLNSQ
jgi:tyrosine-protein kinase Etk/Wzc